MKKQVAEQLLDIEAVQIKTDEKDYFTWTSGIKSPIYCDNRLSISFPRVREIILKGFIQLMEEDHLEVDVIAGCATAGIPHAAFLAERLDLPMVYVRSDRKAHGKGNQIEGVIKEGQRVVVIEDLISTGTSAIKAAKVLEEEGAIISSVLAIFSYNLSKSVKNFKEANLSYKTITSFDHVLQLLLEDGRISQEEKEELLLWRKGL